MQRIIIATLLIVLLTGCAARLTPEQIRAGDPGPYPENYQQITKDYFSKMLFDPYSAVFTFEEPLKGWISGGPSRFGWFVCGTYNAKNRMGGYVGAQDFYTKIWNGRVIDMMNGPMAVTFCDIIKKNQ
jgi:hypothetical protein